MSEPRSGCPINLALEAIGDRWTLVVIRDMMFGKRHYFRELQRESLEKIASNTLADRLKRLERSGMISRADDPSHKQKTRYSLTEKAIQLLPLLVTMGAWGRAYLPVTADLAIRNQILEEGGKELVDAFMDELRNEHLGTTPRASDASVHERLAKAYEALVGGSQ